MVRSSYYETLSGTWPVVRAALFFRAWDRSKRKTRVFGFENKRLVMGVDITRVRRRLLLISFIELLLNFRCDDAFGTMSPLSLSAPAFKVAPRGRNPGACMMHGWGVPTWSNPSGAVLVEVAGGKVWAAERPFMWNSIDVGERLSSGVAHWSSRSLSSLRE